MFYNYIPNAVKTRKRTSQHQLSVLEDVFLTDKKPNGPRRRSLADELRMTPREVQVWFQNRRAKEKKTIAGKADASSPDKDTPRDSKRSNLRADSSSASPAPAPHTDLAPSSSARPLAIHPPPVPLLPQRQHTDADAIDPLAPAPLQPPSLAHHSPWQQPLILPTAPSLPALPLPAPSLPVSTAATDFHLHPHQYPHVHPNPAAYELRRCSLPGESHSVRRRFLAPSPYPAQPSSLFHHRRSIDALAEHTYPANPHHAPSVNLHPQSHLSPRHLPAYPHSGTVYAGADPMRASLSEGAGPGSIGGSSSSRGSSRHSSFGTADGAGMVPGVRYNPFASAGRPRLMHRASVPAAIHASAPLHVSGQGQQGEQQQQGESIQWTNPFPFAPGGSNGGDVRGLADTARAGSADSDTLAFYMPGRDYALHPSASASASPDPMTFEFDYGPHRHHHERAHGQLHQHDQHGYHGGVGAGMNMGMNMAMGAGEYETPPELREYQFPAPPAPSQHDQQHGQGQGQLPMPRAKVEEGDFDIEYSSPGLGGGLESTGIGGGLGIGGGGLGGLGDLSGLGGLGGDARTEVGARNGSLGSIASVTYSESTSSSNGAGPYLSDMQSEMDAFSRRGSCVSTSDMFSEMRVGCPPDERAPQHPQQHLHPHSHQQQQQDLHDPRDADRGYPSYAHAHAHAHAHGHGHGQDDGAGTATYPSPASTTSGRTEPMLLHQQQYALSSSELAYALQPHIGDESDLSAPAPASASNPNSVSSSPSTSTPISTPASASISASAPTSMSGSGSGSASALPLTASSASASSPGPGHRDVHGSAEPEYPPPPGPPGPQFAEYAGGGGYAVRPLTYGPGTGGVPYFAPHDLGEVQFQ